MHAEESDRFKTDFLGALGHDLRNPLNTILTTVRLLVMRPELPPELAKRLDRVVMSGVRMQRMIEQVVDATERGDDLVLASEQGQDVADVVASVIDEARLSHPERRIDLLVDGKCSAAIDRDRIDQVLRTLVGNALAHGAVDRPVRVVVEARPRSAVVDVHNHGTPIDEALRDELFDPYRRRRAMSPARLPEGLGLGLYIARRIVMAHDGRLEVESSAESGTCFRMTLPIRA